MMSDQKILAALADKLGSNSTLAEALGVTWGRLKNWRIYRDVPPAFRMRVATLANMHGFKLDSAWIDRAQPNTEGKTNGRTGKGKKPKVKAARKAQRRGTQQRREGRRVSQQRHSGRGAGATP